MISGAPLRPEASTGPRNEVGLAVTPAALRRLPIFGLRVASTAFFFDGIAVARTCATRLDVAATDLRRFDTTDFTAEFLWLGATAFLRARLVGCLFAMASLSGYK